MATLMPVNPSSAGSSTDSAAQNRSAKLHTAVQQFEALMIGEMLKAAHTDDSDDALDDSDDGGGDSTMQMAQSQLSSALASRGGFGLAAMIEKSMSRDVSRDQQATEIVGFPVAASPK